MQNIRIELPKGVEDGKTSLSPSNPPRSNSGSPVVSNRGKIIAGVGLKGIVVVNTPDALVVVPKDEVVNITKLVKKTKTTTQIVR